MAASSSGRQRTSSVDVSSRQKMTENRKTGIRQCASPVTSEGSVFSDSDNANFSSANSTLSFGKQGKTSHREALATLDFFLSDISQTTEKVKQEEEERMQSVKNESATPTTEKFDSVDGVAHQDSVERMKSWKSLPSVFEGDHGEFTETNRQKSLCDIRLDENTMPDRDSEFTSHDQKKEGYAQSKASEAGSSMSSQTSDATQPNTYGLQQLDHLCIFLEKYKQLQQQNSELSKRVSNLETRSAVWGRSAESKVSPKRYSASFLAPSDKPLKKVKPTKLKAPGDKFKGKKKYLASLPFILATKSTDNLKHASSHNLDGTRAKIHNRKKVYSYAADDMEIGKSLHDAEQQWRNSSVKNPYVRHLDERDAEHPSSNSLEEGLLMPKPRVEEATAAAKPLVVVSEDASAPVIGAASNSREIEINESGNSKLESIMKYHVPVRSKSEERSSRNTRKMTEWTTLQQAFPTPQIDTNIDLLSQLEQILSSSKQQSKKYGPLPGIRGRTGRSRKPKSPTHNANMFLPPAETPGFTSTFLAAHAMANQLTVTLNLSEIELLSSPDTDTTASQSFNGQPIPIS